MTNRAHGYAKVLARDLSSFSVTSVVGPLLPQLMFSRRRPILRMESRCSILRQHERLLRVSAGGCEQMSKRRLLFAIAGLLLLGAPGRAQEGYKIIVNPANPVTALTKAQVSKFFLEKSTWDDGLPVSPVDLATTSSVREIFSSKRAEIQQTIEAELRTRLAGDGIALRSVVIGKVDLQTPIFSNEIEDLTVSSADPYLNELLVANCEQALFHRHVSRATFRDLVINTFCTAAVGLGKFSKKGLATTSGNLVDFQSKTCSPGGRGPVFGLTACRSLVASPPLCE